MFFFTSLVHIFLLVHIFFVGATSLPPLSINLPSLVGRICQHVFYYIYNFKKITGKCSFALWIQQSLSRFRFNSGPDQRGPRWVYSTPSSANFVRKDAAVQAPPQRSVPVECRSHIVPFSWSAYSCRGSRERERESERAREREGGEAVVLRWPERNAVRAGKQLSEECLIQCRVKNTMCSRRLGHNVPTNAFFHNWEP